MSRRSWILFLIPVVIWSTTFYAITLQLGSVTTPTYAVGLRFGCAALMLFVWLAIRGEPLRLTPKLHAWTAASGVCAYGISYVLTYIAEQSIPSGLVAIAFTLMVFLTPALTRLVYGTPITRLTWLGGSLGVVGVVMCFLPDVMQARVSDAFVWGMVAMAVAALVSSIGAVCSIKLNRIGVPVVTYTAWAMAYGAAATFAYGQLSGQVLRLDSQPLFWAAFAYLTVAGTIVTFLCYLTLLKREGSARTMYISVLAPVGAVLVSIIWEGLQLQVLTLFGILIALSGAWITLSKKTT
ncbi:MAG: DMT family transporter [Rhizobacter sp.]|nr:DMT family transporter [Burkholderiales bacterium]